MGAGESNLANTSLGQYAMKSRDVAVGVLRSVTAGGTTGFLARIEVQRVLKGEGQPCLWERPLVESGKPTDLDPWEKFLRDHDTEAKRRAVVAEKKVAQGKPEEAPAPLRDPWAMVFYDHQGYLSGYALQRGESALSHVAFDKLALEMYSIGQPRKRFISPHIAVSHFTLKQPANKFVVSYRGPLCFLMGGRGVAADRLVTVETDMNAEITHMEPWVRNLRLPGPYEKVPPTVVFSKHLTLEYGDKTRHLTLSGVVGRESDKVEGEDLSTVQGAAAAASSQFHLPMRMWVTRPLLLSSWALEHYANHREFDSVYYVLLLQLRTNKDTNTTDYKMRAEFRLGFFSESKMAPGKDSLVGLPDSVSSLPLKLIRCEPAPALPPGTEAPPAGPPGSEAASNVPGPSLVFGADSDGSMVGGLMSMVSFSELKLTFEAPRKAAFTLPTHTANEVVLHSVLQHVLVRPLAVSNVTGYGLDGASGLLQLRAVVFFNSMNGIARWVLVDSAMQPLLGKGVDLKQLELTEKGMSAATQAGRSPFPLEEPPQAVASAPGPGGPSMPSAPPRFIARKGGAGAGGAGPGAGHAAKKPSLSPQSSRAGMPGGGGPSAPGSRAASRGGSVCDGGPDAPGLVPDAPGLSSPGSASKSGSSSPGGLMRAPSGGAAPGSASPGSKGGNLGSPNARAPSPSPLPGGKPGMGTVAAARAGLAAGGISGAAGGPVKGAGSGANVNAGGAKQVVQLRPVSGPAPKEGGRRVEDDWKEYMGWYDEDGEWVSGHRDKWGNWVTGYYDAGGRWVGGYFDTQDHWHYDFEFVEPRPVLRHVEAKGGAVSK